MTVNTEELSVSSEIANATTIVTHLSFSEDFGVGRLGATFDPSQGMHGAAAAQIDMIERRILRLEMVLRRAGIEPETVELPR